MARRIRPARARWSCFRPAYLIATGTGALRRRSTWPSTRRCLRRTCRSHCRSSRVPEVDPPRSWLFAPGHDEKLLSKVFDVGADMVLLDLEDAVPVELK